MTENSPTDYELNPDWKFPYINWYRILYDLVLMISGLFILEYLFSKDFKVDEFWIPLMWLAIVIIFPTPDKARSKIIP